MEGASPPLSSNSVERVKAKSSTPWAPGRPSAGSACLPSMAGRSLDSVWIPTIVVTHLLGIAMALYAIQALSGALTGLLLYMRWRCGCCLPKKSVERELADASLPGGVFPNGTVANGYPPQVHPLTAWFGELPLRDPFRHSPKLKVSRTVLSSSACIRVINAFCTGSGDDQGDARRFGSWGG